MSDLLILKQLQMDGNRTLAEMAESLKINYKTLTWHFRKHIEERKLIKGYVIKWMGTTYDYKAERSANKKHTYLWVVVMFTDLDQARRLEVMARLNQLPFIWSEAVGDTYEAELVFPIESPDGGPAVPRRGHRGHEEHRKVLHSRPDELARLHDNPGALRRSEAEVAVQRARLARDCDKLLLEIREGTARAVPSDFRVLSSSSQVSGPGRRSGREGRCASPRLARRKPRGRHSHHSVSDLLVDSHATWSAWPRP